MIYNISTINPINLLPIPKVDFSSLSKLFLSVKNIDTKLQQEEIKNMNLTTIVQDLQSSINLLNSQLNALQQQVNKNIQDLVTLNNVVINNSNADDLEEKANNAAITLLSQQVEEAKSVIYEIKNQMSQAENDISLLQSFYSDMNQKVLEINNRVASLKNEVVSKEDFNISMNDIEVAIKKLNENNVILDFNMQEVVTLLNADTAIIGELQQAIVNFD